MFRPPHCPHEACTAHVRGNPFPWRRRGTYFRLCDGRHVQRFQCLTCRRGFSTQTFRVDYRLRRNDLNHTAFLQLASKTTLRQLSRVLGCQRQTVERRLDRFGEHARLFHAERLMRSKQHGGLSGSFVLDELETYEGCRKLKPLTVPVLVEANTCFVVDLAVAKMAPRGARSPRESKRLAAIEALEGKRRSGSRQAVEGVFGTLADVLANDLTPRITTDKKKTYPGCMRRALGREHHHSVVSSKRRRDVKNPLFPINFTFAMMRDGLSRLVRRTWAASKKSARLERHVWLWVGWRNYVRYWKNNDSATRESSAAREAGVEK